MDAGQALADAAASLIGVPFRLYGRSRAEGVDCIGLLGCALAESGRTATLPRGYGLRNRDPDRHMACLPATGFAQLEGDSTIRPGDVLIVSPGPAQQHVLIALGQSAFVHAHAGLRRVALAAAPLPWPILHRWRLNTASER